MIIGAGRLIEQVQEAGHDVQLQVSMTSGYIDLYDTTADKPLTSWSEDEIIEYQDVGQRLLEDVMETALHYGVPIKVVKG